MITDFCSYTFKLWPRYSDTCTSQTPALFPGPIPQLYKTGEPAWDEANKPWPSQHLRHLKDLFMYGAHADMILSTSWYSAIHD